MCNELSIEEINDLSTPAASQENSELLEIECDCNSAFGFHESSCAALLTVAEA